MKILILLRKKILKLKRKSQAKKLSLKSE